MRKLYLKIYMVYFYLFILTFKNMESLDLRFKRSSVVVNDLVDPILETLRKNIIDNGKNVVPVNDFKQISTVSLFGKKRKYLILEGKNCTIRDLSTIYRINDVILIRYDEDGLTVRFKIGLKLFQYTCCNYYLKLIRLIRFRGEFKAEIDEVNVAFEVTIHHEKTECFFNVGYIKIDNIDGIKINLTGFSILNKFVSNIAGWTVKKFKNEIEVEAEKELVKVLISTIEDTKSCHFQ